MRNPLKKIQKKINLRLASSKATQQQKQQPQAVVIGKDTSASSPNKPQQQQNTSSSSPENYNESCTSLCQYEDGDPLFGNIIDTKIALMDSSNKKASTTKDGTKKKKRGRFSFGGRKSIGSSPKKQGPLYQEPQPPPLSPSSKRQQQESQTLLPQTPEGTEEEEVPQEKHVPTTPPKQDRSLALQEEAPISPESPSSNLHIPAPPLVQRSDPVPTAEFNDGDANVPTKRKIVRSPTPPPSKPQQQHQNNQNQQQHHHYVHMDPNVERIAKAAAALDNTGNQAFERGEFDKAMQIYSRALKLKKRTLTNLESQQDDEEEGSEEVSHEKKTPVPATKPVHNSSETKHTPEQQHQRHHHQHKPANKEGSPAAGADELWISVATSINNIGYLRQQSGQASAEETMQAYQNSLQIKRRVLGKDNLSVGKTLNNLGTVHYLKRDYKQALKHYKEALQIMKTTLGAYHLDVGTVHSNIGDVYWAQSGDTKAAATAAGANNNTTSHCPQRNYQSSRDSALRHYRHSLEIRWEQLQDHHDPKVIRLLEKIAALEMGESFLALVQNNQQYRPATLGAGDNTATTTGDTNATATDPHDEDEAMEHEHSKLPPVEQEIQTLHQDIKKDVQTMDLMERKMAIDMVKDKLRLIREMKNLSNLDIYNLDLDEELSMADDPYSSPSKSPLNKAPLSPVQRTEALSALKMRLSQLRESRKKGTNNDHLWKAQASSGLMEIDGSPTHQYLSQKASNLLNRFNQMTDLSTLDDSEPPSAAISTQPGKGLDMLRNFSLGLDTQKNDDDGKASESHQQTTKAFSPRTSNTLNQGIGALRSLSLNTDTTATEPAPWLAGTSSTFNKQPLVATETPTTPLPAASMASF